MGSRSVIDGESESSGEMMEVTSLTQPGLKFIWVLPNPDASRTTDVITPYPAAIPEFEVAVRSAAGGELSEGCRSAPPARQYGFC
jgi:hypothetical protein